MRGNPNWGATVVAAAEAGVLYVVAGLDWGHGRRGLAGKARCARGVYVATSHGR
jgi:hypothetical protein